MNVKDIPIVALLLRNDPDALNPVVIPIEPPVIVTPVVPVTPVTPNPSIPSTPGIENPDGEKALDDFLMSELVDSITPSNNVAPVILPVTPVTPSTTASQESQQ